MATLNEKIGLARALFGTDRTDAPSVNRISGTATADSSDGTVTVQLEDGDIVELGCIGSVRQGQTVTVHVQGASAQVVAAEGWGDALQESVDEAVEVATATGQHFWDDDNGAHVTEVTREDWETQPSGFNALWNSLELLFRRALNNLVAITQSAVTFYDGDGNDAENITASFGGSGFQVGTEGSSRLVGEDMSLELIDSSGFTYFKLQDLTGEYFTDTFTGDGTEQVFSLSLPFFGYAPGPSSMTVTVDDVVIPFGSSGWTSSSTPDGTGSYVAKIHFATAPADGAEIEATYQSTDGNAKSLFFGRRRNGAGKGAMSVSLGFATEASGTYSHAQNHGTVASSQAQTALGRFNVADDVSAVIIGNGTGDSARSNALTVDWDGNVEAAGGLTLYGGTAFHDMLTIETHTSAAIGSIAASGTKWVTVDCTKSGYKLLGPIGYYINGATALTVYACNRSSTTACQAALRNPTSSASSSTAKLEIQALYVKAL